MYFLLKIVFFCELALAAARLTEEQRVEQWHRKGNTWPPKWQPESEAYRKAMEIREREIMNIPGSNERWENWMQFTGMRLVKKFTETGFLLTKTPEHIHNYLKSKMDTALENWDNVRLENQIDVVYTPNPSKFIDLHSYANKMLEELRPLHEAWGGMELVGSSAYGIRAYQNGSSLVMHVDKVK